MWKGVKAVVVTLKSVQKLKIKNRLLLDHSNEMCVQFEEYLKILEDELANDENKSNSSINSPNVLFATKLLVHSTKIYNDFVYLKNVFEMDCEDLRAEDQIFNLEQYFLY